ncbi:MAG: hypothetical protein ACKVS5_02650 [Parvularculaceae bacterium]
MTGDLRRYKSLLKLLKVARHNAERASRALGDLHASKSGVEAALARLDTAIRAEEEVALGRTEIGFLDLAGYLAGAAQKRAALRATSDGLTAEIAAAGAALEACELERRKLEHLADLMAQDLRKARLKRDNTLLDDAGRRRLASLGQRRF